MEIRIKGGGGWRGSGRVVVSDDGVRGSLTVSGEGSRRGWG